MSAEKKSEIALTVNGEKRGCSVPHRRLLADVLRHDLGLTGTHVGCEHGVCGACTVLIDGVSARSCLTLAVQADGCAIETVEGLSSCTESLNPLQQAFWDKHGLQCGFCTPGILMSLTELLRDDPAPSEEKVRLVLSGHLCRCTGYQNIVAAALEAVRLSKSSKRIEKSEPVGTRVVGARARRIEDPVLLRGEGRYLDDIGLEGTLHAAFVRSSHAHARIVSVDASEARKVPGVVAVLEANDLKGELTSARMPLGFPSATLQKNITPWVLSDREVAFVGEAIAMVVADSRYAAEDAAALVQVDYEPLDTLVDPRLALDPRTPKVRAEAESNVAEKMRVGYGDATGAFAQAKHVFRESFYIHRGAAHSMEGRGVLARYDAAEERMTIWSSTQLAHEVMHAAADMLGMDASRVRVIAPNVGGGFGAKFMVYPEEVAIPAAARKLGRPVKWVEDRAEHFVSAIHERDQYWDMEIAVDAEARILGLRGRLVHDQGAYTPQGINCAYNAASSVTGCYMVPAYELDLYAVQTNRTPVAPVRGAGYPQAAFVMERLIDRVARELALDRVEVRRRNLIPKEKIPYDKKLKSRSGASSVVDSGDFHAALDKVLERIDYHGFAARQKKALAEKRHLGLGVVTCIKATGRGPFESAAVRISPHGRVSIYTGALAMGQGLGTALAQIAAEQLGVPLESIEVTSGDTGAISLGMGGFASRQALMAGSAVHKAALEVRRKALKAAEQLLEASEKDLVLRNGRVEVNGVPNLGISLGDIARKLKGAPGYSMPGGVSPGLEANTTFETNTQAHASACHACELEVDVATGGVRILRYVAVHDSGTLINPMMAEGQVHGSIVHGLGNALFEKMAYDENAQPLTGTFADYLLPTATEVPHMEILFQESPSPTNPIGVKGIGEVGTIPVQAVVISAIEDALSPFGVRINEAPLSPMRILELLGSKN